MRKLKCKNYDQVIKAEYARLRRATKNKAAKTTLTEMGDLLKNIEPLESPAKEFAFVEGVIRLANRYNIAA